ncbi:MAG: Gldg family protein [Myxococcota bacterium]
MSAMFTIAGKELRALFKSAVAVLFLEAFLMMTLFLFFEYSTFFARGLADVRPMFEWLPLLLIALVSATTMRAWAEERRAGTLEVLLTLPIRTVDLVMGKFLAGMALVALALLFTLPIPVAVSFYGPLDWGPVYGGYFAALLLASTYLAIGLCVSARTDNQVVALLVTVLVGGLLYLVGTDGVTDLFSAGTAELLRGLGTGSRFESIERGVFDLRDIVYYGSLTTFFLVLNMIFLETERIDTQSSTGAVRNFMLVGLVALVGANVVMANLWLTPIRSARLDLTENGEYTISPVTRDVLRELDEPLVIRAFITERTHPKLAALVPRLRDTLAEYEIYGDGRVVVEMEDPSTNEDLKTEITEQYSIRSVPMGVADNNSQSIVNTYFHIVVTYGDQFEVLSFEDLIEVVPQASGDFEVKLRNLEYDLTRTVRKVTSEFQSIDSLLAQLPEPATLTLYESKGITDENFQATAQVFQEVGEQLQTVGKDQLVFATVDPTTDPTLPQELYDEYGIQPIPQSLQDALTGRGNYLHMLLEVGGKATAFRGVEGMTANDVEQAIEAALRKATPGQLKKIAIFTEKPIQLPNPNIPPQFQPPPPQPDYRFLEQTLGTEYEVQRTMFEEGQVDQDVDVLFVGKTGQMTDAQRFAVDQYLMRGGSVVALAGAFRIEPQPPLSTRPTDPGLRNMLKTYGVKVDNSLVMDNDNVPLPLPIQNQLVKVRYPYFPNGFGVDRLNPDHAAATGIQSLVLPWVSPVSTVEDELEGREIEWIVRSSEDAWLDTDGRIDQDSVDRRGVPMWNERDDKKVRDLAISLTGRFPSAFAGSENPLSTEEEQRSAPLEASVADGRLVVVGTSELMSDLMSQLARDPAHAASLQLVANLIDWSAEDTDLLQIRSAGAFARTLVAIDEEEATWVEVLTWFFVLVPPLLLVVALVVVRRAANSEQEQTA